MDWIPKTALILCYFGFGAGTHSPVDVRLRSPRELAFRLTQQAANLSDLCLRPPRFHEQLNPVPLADPNSVRTALNGSSYAEDLRVLCSAILSGELPIFGESLATGSRVDWRRDYRNGVATPERWFKRIPFLDFDATGDHKYIWEINRQQHLVALAQHALLSGDRAPIERIESDVRSWHEQNPFVRCINWASGLELAFRSLSWIWVLHLAGPQLSSATRKLLANLLWQHGRVIEHNLSTYFAPNTHILGEGVALHALGIVLGREKLRRKGAAIVDRELARQVGPDGFHFELSSYYHVYALDMLLFHYLLARRPERYRDVLVRMAQAIASLLDEQRTFPLIGDDDGGRFFHPYGCRRGFANATLATCAALFPEAGLPGRNRDLPEQAFWWLGPSEVSENTLADLAQYSTAGGLTVFRRDGAVLTFDCGPMSRGSAGHSHSDALAITLRVHGQELLTDPGTFTYTGDRALRDWFRGTGAHSTVKLGGRDQADPVHPFRWENKPSVRRIAAEAFRATGECIYNGWRHERTVDWTDPRRLIISDSISGDCSVEQIWLSPVSLEGRIETDAALTRKTAEGWRSTVYGSRERSVLVTCNGGPGTYRTIISLPEFHP